MNAKIFITDEELEAVEPAVEVYRGLMLSALMDAFEADALEDMGISIDGDASEKPVGIIKP